MNLEYVLVLLALCLHTSSGSALHGQCFFNEECGTIDTFCKDGTCVCKKNFAVHFDSCIQLATPRIACKRKEECHRHLGARSMCTKSSHCACKPFHHLVHNQCVKNRDLEDICEHDHQCYCGADCVHKIACIHRNCTCKPGYKAYGSRRCIALIPETTSTLPVKEAMVTSSSIESCSSYTLIFVTILYFLYYI